MYNLNVKRLLIVLLILFRYYGLFSQEEKNISDTLLIIKDSLLTDTILRPLSISPDAVDKTITHTAKGYRRTDLVNKKVYLVEEAIVTYGDITLEADSIVLNTETGVIYAAGRPDSTGKMNGRPVFKQGEESFESEALEYNFKTRKGRVFNLVTQQEEGYLRSKITKRFDDGSLNIGASTYSTCDAETPHFYIGFKKAKVVPGKKIVTGPAYLVLEGIPLPVMIPFGYFPLYRKNTATSGIIMPKIGQTYELGYSLRDGGYYFAINDKIDLAVTGTLYTNGTWMLNAASSYFKRYKYSGRISLSYANNVTGHKGLSDFIWSRNYRIDWSYAQDPKASPGSRFSASVSMSSSSFDRQNSYIPAEHVNTTKQSSISYSKTWESTPFNFSVSLNHSQNVQNKTVSLNLPQANFSMSRIYPLKSKKRTRQSRWYEDLQFQYSAKFDNRIENIADSLLFTNSVFNKMRNGFRHDAPLSLQIRPFKKIPDFIISPQLSYSGVLYTQKYNKRLVVDYFDPELGSTKTVLLTDTLRGFFYGQAVNASISTGINPQLYGMYLFRPGSRIEAIRHVIKTSVSFSYVPVIKGLSTNMYRQYTDVSGNTRTYSIFEGNVFGTPSLGTRSGGVSFSLVNIVEAKVHEKNDTTGKEKKIKIIENLSAGTYYNIFADSLRWSPVGVNFRTTLLENIGIAASSSLSFYGTDTSGKIINTFYIKQSGKPLRLTNFGISVDLDVYQLLGGKKKNTGTQTSGMSAATGFNEELPERIETPAVPQQKGTFDNYGYAKFDMPWSMRLAYSFNYSKQYLTSSVTQTLSLVGDLSLTKKTRITYTTGFDFGSKQITMTSIGIYRDLHCWDMNFEWIPIGSMKSWYFTIKVKASVLADLKYERRKDFHDQYY
ncbi:MAG: putative LPS assembly protein LptD [Bacteroidales bacterium]